jgi:hypothetical protein
MTLSAVDVEGRAAFAAQLAGLGPRDPIPILALPHEHDGPGLCISCGDALGLGQTWRCQPCLDVVRLVLRKREER